QYFRDIMQRGDVNAQAIASHLAYACVVAPANPDEAAAILRMAEFGIGATPSNPRLRGAANYRAGNYEATIADLNQSAKAFPRRAWDWIFVAMAQHKLGNSEEATKSLQKAAEWIEQANRPRPKGSGDIWISWYEPVEVQQLLREAKDLIR